MYSEQLDLRNSAYTGYSLPPQAIPSNQKDERWQKACMDAMENIGMRQISRKYLQFQDTFRILEGNFKYKDVVNSSHFLSEVDSLRNQAEIHNSLENFGFIEPIVNHLIGEYLKLPDPTHIYADDQYSTNDYLEAKTTMLWSTVSQQVDDMLNTKMIKRGLNPFQEEFESQEEQEAYIQQTQEFKQKYTPSFIQKHMDEGWIPIYVQWAEATLESDYAIYDIDELDRESLYQYLATGQCFRHFLTGYDYYEPENWNVTETFNDDTSATPEDGDFVGQVRYESANTFLSKWGHLYSEDEKQRILRSKNYNRDALSFYKASTPSSVFDWATKGGGSLHIVPHQGYYPYKNMQYVQEELGIDLGYNGYFPNGREYDDFLYYNETERTDLIRYTYGYWVSQQRIGYLTLFDEEIGELVTKKVTDEILEELIKEKGIKKLRTVSLDQHKANPKPNTIVFDYKPQVWRGLKLNKMNTDLNDDLYKAVEPLAYQLKGNSQEYHTKLPVAGIYEKTSFVSRLEKEQTAYNIAMNLSRDYMTKELGVFFLLDMSYLPGWLKDYGGEESLSKLTDLIRELGILPIDGEHNRSQFNQLTSVNMDLTQMSLGKLEYAQAIKRIAFEKVGFTPERLGLPTPSQKTATAVQASSNASFNQTEIWFDKFAKFQKRYGEMHLNIAQYMKKEGIDGSVNLVDNYMRRTFINMSDPMLPMRRFRIAIENNAKRRSELEVIKQVYMNDNTIVKDLESLAEVISADSTAKVIQLAKYGRELAEINRQKAEEAEQQRITLEQSLEAEREQIQRDWEARENQLDRRAGLLEKQIMALGFEKDPEEINEVIGQTKNALEQLKLDIDARHKELDYNQRVKESTDNTRLKERELDIKDKSEDTKKYIADKQLEVARENKTDAELKAKKKGSEKKK